MNVRSLVYIVCVRDPVLETARGWLSVESLARGTKLGRTLCFQVSVPGCPRIFAGVGNTGITPSATVEMVVVGILVVARYTASYDRKAVELGVQWSTIFHQGLGYLRDSDSVDLDCYVSLGFRVQVSLFSSSSDSAVCRQMML